VNYNVVIINIYTTDLYYIVDGILMWFHYGRKLDCRWNYNVVTHSTELYCQTREEIILR
jgi:hypothetical protein